MGAGWSSISRVAGPAIKAIARAGKGGGKRAAKALAKAAKKGARKRWHMREKGAVGRAGEHLPGKGGQKAEGKFGKGAKGADKNIKDTFSPIKEKTADGKKPYSDMGMPNSRPGAAEVKGEKGPPPGAPVASPNAKVDSMPNVAENPKAMPTPPVGGQGPGSDASTEPARAGRRGYRVSRPGSEASTEPAKAGPGGFRVPGPGRLPLELRPNEVTGWDRAQMVNSWVNKHAQSVERNDPRIRPDRRLNPLWWSTDYSDPSVVDYMAQFPKWPPRFEAVGPDPRARFRLPSPKEIMAFLGIAGTAGGITGGVLGGGHSKDEKHDHGKRDIGGIENTIGSLKKDGEAAGVEEDAMALEEEEVSNPNKASDLVGEVSDPEEGTLADDLPPMSEIVQDFLEDRFAMDSAQDAGLLGSEVLASSGDGGPFIITTGGPPGSTGAHKPGLTRRSESLDSPTVDDFQAHVTGSIGSTYASNGVAQLVLDAPYACGSSCEPRYEPSNLLLHKEDALAHQSSDCLFNAPSERPHVDPPFEQNGIAWSDKVEGMSDPFASVVAMPMGIGLGLWNRNENSGESEKEPDELRSEAQESDNPTQRQDEAKQHHSRRDADAQVADERQQADDPLSVTYDGQYSAFGDDGSPESDSENPEHMDGKGPSGNSNLTDIDLDLAILVKYDESTVTPEDLPYLHNMHISVTQPGRLLIGDVFAESPWTSHGYIGGIGDVPTQDGWKTGNIGFYLPNHNDLIHGWWVSTTPESNCDVRSSFSDMYHDAKAHQPQLHLPGLETTVMSNLKMQNHSAISY